MQIPPSRPTAHAGLEFTSLDLLTALVAERLDRLADRMVARGLSRLVVLGRFEHASWLHDKIHAMRSLPIAAYVPTPWSSESHDGTWRGSPVVELWEPRLLDVAEAVLISDDRFEDVLHQEALRVLPPGVVIHRLYERLPIGTERPQRLSPVTVKSVGRRALAG